jgi:hypothetical protein
LVSLLAAFDVLAPCFIEEAKSASTAFRPAAAAVELTVPEERCPDPSALERGRPAEVSGTKTANAPTRVPAAKLKPGNTCFLDVFMAASFSLFSGRRPVGGG